MKNTPNRVGKYVSVCNFLVFYKSQMTCIIGKCDAAVFSKHGPLEFYVNFQISNIEHFQIRQEL